MVKVKGEYFERIKMVLFISRISVLRAQTSELFVRKRITFNRSRKSRSESFTNYPP
jgi:hypothetical protein